MTTVLVYHAVADWELSDDSHLLAIPPSRFAAQLDYLVRSRTVVSLEDAVARVRTPKPAVSITFDDGYRVLLEHAVPLLEQRGLPATVFVPTAFLGDRNRWDESPPPVAEIMSADELRLVESRGIAVESHGHGHLDLSGATEDEAAADLAPSVEVLEEVLGRRPRFLAYPFAEGSPAAQRVAERLGFRAAFKAAGRDRGSFARARVCVSRLDPPWLFRLQTAGRYPTLRHSSLGEAAFGIAGRLRRAVGPRRAAG